jgi:hypothetical protein
MAGLITSFGRAPRQRTTLYADAPAGSRRAANQAEALKPVVFERRHAVAVA